MKNIPVCWREIIIVKVVEVIKTENIEINNKKLCLMKSLVRIQTIVFTREMIEALEGKKCINDMQQFYKFKLPIISKYSLEEPDEYASILNFAVSKNIVTKCTLFLQFLKH